jgi:hypothetical protein
VNLFSPLHFPKKDWGEARLVYRVNHTGTYKIENSHIIYDYGDIENNGVVELLSAEGSTGNETFIEELTSQLESTLVPAFRERFANENAVEIHKLNRKEFVRFISVMVGR